VISKSTVIATVTAFKFELR